MTEFKPKRKTFWIVVQMLNTTYGLYPLTRGLYTTKKAANRSKRELIQEDSSRRGTLKVQKIKLLLENS